MGVLEVRAHNENARASPLLKRKVPS
jgi:hypothetical protein